jgi:hypothetical protein
VHEQQRDNARVRYCDFPLWMFSNLGIGYVNVEGEVEITLLGALAAPSRDQIEACDDLIRGHASALAGRRGGINGPVVAIAGGILRIAGDQGLLRLRFNEGRTWLES